MTSEARKDEMSYDFELSHGAGKTPDEACLMQRAALIHAERHGYLDRVPIGKVLTDHPCWANEALTNIGIACNDFSSDADRQRLRPLIERILTCTRKAPEVERRINARILCHQARKILHLIRPEDREVCERAIATREAWLRGEATEEDCAEAAEAAGAAWAARAAEAAGAAWAAEAARAAEAAGAAWAAEAAGAAWAAWAARAADWFDWLDEALDVHAKACAEEGVLVDDSEAERLVGEFVQSAGA